MRSLKSLYLSSSNIDGVSDQVRHKPLANIGEEAKVLPLLGSLVKHRQ